MRPAIGIHSAMPHRNSRPLDSRRKASIAPANVIGAAVKVMRIATGE